MGGWWGWGLLVEGVRGRGGGCLLHELYMRIDVLGK